MNLTIEQKIYNMSNEQLKVIWDSFNVAMWDEKTMYDENTTMDEWAMIIMSEMDYRRIPK